jgi:hypothetical protein
VITPPDRDHLEGHLPVISRPGPRPNRASGAKLIVMYRTRVAAKAALVPVVAAVMAAVIVAVIVAAVAGTAALAVTAISAGAPGGGFHQDGGNRGWSALAPTTP